jgi:Mannitol repressor
VGNPGLLERARMQNMPKVSKPAFLRDYDWVHFRTQYETTDDRSCAILFTAYLDNCLGEAFLNITKYPDDASKSLLKDTAPMGTLSAKINLLWVLGHLSEPVYRDLNLIRKIRNEFAHEVTASSFNHDPVRSWCLELRLPHLRSESQVYEELREDLRTLFIVSGALCEGELYRAYGKVHPQRSD